MLLGLTTAVTCIEATSVIPAGYHQVRMEFNYDGGGLAKAESSPRFMRGIRLRTCAQIELLGGTVCRAPGHGGVGGKRQRNPGQVVHAHPCGHGDRNYLDDLDRPLANNVAAQDRAGRAVRDQLESNISLYLPNQPFYWPIAEPATANC